MGRPVVHFEIGCRDAAATGHFYQQLFDWTTTPMGPALGIQTGSEAGIGGHISSLGHEPHNFVTVYVDVEDLEASCRHAEELGGRTVVPPTEIGAGMGRFAWIADPEGTTMGLWQKGPL